MLVLVTVVAMAVPGEHYTGTNGIAVQSYVTTVRSGERLCVRDLRVPAGTGRVRMEADWPGSPGPRFEASLRTLEGTAHSEVSPRGTAKGPLDIPFPVVRAQGPSTPAEFCITPMGKPVKIGGKKELIGRHVLPTVQGRPLHSEVAIWFLPPKGREQSALSLVPDALRRAALFRPGFVGAWTYVLLLFVLTPLLWLASIRLLATRSAGLTGRRTALSVGAIAFATAATWAFLTPAFDAPDEPDHYSYTQTLAETGDAPEKSPSERPAYSSRLTIALDAVRIYGRAQQSNERPPWLALDQDRFEHRAQGASDNGGGYLPSSSSHSPAYYALTAAAYLATPSGNTFSKLLSMRLVSALLAAFTAAFVFLTLRELLPRHEWVAVGAGLLVAFQPMFGFISGSVNNDAGVNAAAAALVYLLIRGLRRGLTLPTGVALGALLILAPLMKGTAYALWPAALVGVAGMLWRRHSRRDLPGYAGIVGAAAVVQAAWSVLAGSFNRTSFTTPGGSSPTASRGVASGPLHHPLEYASYVWQVFLPRLPFMTDYQRQRWPAFDIYVERGWAAFGWYAMKFAHWVYLVIALVMVAAAALCVAAVWRFRQAARRLNWELAVLVVALGGVIAGVEAAYFTTTGRNVVAEQGRYAFTAIVPLAAIALGGSFAFGSRRAPVVAAGLVAAVIGLSFASQMLALTRFFT